MAHDYTFDVRGGRKLFTDQRLHDQPATTHVIKQGAEAAAGVRIVIPVFERRETVLCLQYIAQSLEASGSTAHLAVVDQSLTPSVQKSILAALHRYTTSHTFTTIVYHHDASLTISSAKNAGAACYVPMPGQNVQTSCSSSLIRTFTFRVALLPHWSMPPLLILPLPLSVFLPYGYTMKRICTISKIQPIL
jgi:hypothetical protein